MNRPVILVVPKNEVPVTKALPATLKSLPVVTAPAAWIPFVVVVIVPVNELEAPLTKRLPPTEA